MPTSDTLLKQYEISIDLFKFYLDLTIKLNVFYYAVTGGIFSFYFANIERIPDVKFSLLLPLVMSLAFSVFFIYGAYLIKPMRQDVFDIRDALKLNVAPELQVLVVFLYIFVLVFAVISFGCIYLIWLKC